MKHKLGLWVVAMATSVAVLAQTNVYVSPTGSNTTGTGSAAAPYATIAFAVSAAQFNFNNAIVNVAPGVYNETTGIFINEAIVLRKNGAGTVLINAAGRTPAPGSEYMLAINGASNVSIDGIAFHNFVGNGARAIWVLGSGSNITVQNCLVRNVGWTNSLSVLPPNNGTVANAIKIEGNQAAPLKNVKLLSNTVRFCATGWGEAITLTGNVDSFFVEQNMVDSTANIGIVAAGNYANTGAPPAVNQARRGFIGGNTVSHCMSGIRPSAGIYLDGAINCRVERNRSFQNGVGISIGGEEAVGIGAATPGGHTIANNILHSNVLAGIFWGTNNATNAVQQTRVYNNTLFKNRTGQAVNGITTVAGEPVAQAANDFGGELHLQNINGGAMQNNIIYPLANKRAILAGDGYRAAGFAANYNWYCREGAGALFDLSNDLFNGQLITNYYDDLVALQTATGLELQANAGLPGFVDATAFNLALSNAAAATDKGNPVYDASLSGLVDYVGNPRVDNDIRIDCGAYEYRYATVYTFTGNGNWDAAANWLNGNIPPQSLPAGAQIVINPAGSGTCIVNRVQQILTGASVIVKPNKKLLLPGNLVIN